MIRKSGFSDKIMRKTKAEIASNLRRVNETGKLRLIEKRVSRRRQMARVALVTGGTRGIGAAISKALKAAGYKVAASYAGNDAAAEKFKSETGIPVYKWDVASFDACAAG